ncbi:MAG: ribokinase [Chloroflexota bacterium]|nr:MAG: ribokinase [Bellilinea sp.]
MKNVVVIGSLNIDLIAKTPHAPAAGETVNAEEFFIVPGGKGANQAVGMARLGLGVTLIGRVGLDYFGNFLIRKLEQEKINVSWIFQDLEELTSLAMIILEESGENRIVVAQGANYRIAPSDIDRAEAEFENADLVVCHFGQSHPVLPYILQLAKEKNKKTVVNPAPAFPLSQDLLKSIDYLIVNQGEAEIISGLAVTDLTSAFQAAKQLHSRGSKEVIITLGAEGAIFSTNHHQFHLPAYSVNVVDTTAAGDAFIAGLVYGILKDWSPTQRVQFANACGALASTRIGAISSLPRRVEVEQYLSQRKEADEDPNHLLKTARKRGYKTSLDR